MIVFVVAFASSCRVVAGQEALAVRDEDAQRRAEERAAKTDAMANALVEEWKQERATEIASSDLLSAIRALPYSESIRVPSGARRIDRVDLPQSSRDDLDEALVGLLRAYADGSSEAVVQHRTARGQRVNPALRQAMERGLSQSGVVSDVSALSEEELFDATWTMLEANAHWQGIAVAASSRRVWDGGQVPLKRLERFDANLTDETPLEDLEQSAYLFWLFREVSSPRSNFISTAGLIEESLNKKQKVILCDVQLIIEYDAAFGHRRAACLVRFWWNPRQEKWQPVCLRSYSSDPKQGGGMPSLMF